MSKQTKIQPAGKVKEKAANAWSVQNEMPNKESGSLLPFQYFKHSSYVYSIAYSPNGNQLAAGGEDKKVTIYDLENKGAILHTFEHSNSVVSIAYSPNGNQLAAGGWDKKVTIYDLENKGAILHTFEHSSNVSSIAYSPNGNQLAAGGGDKNFIFVLLPNIPQYFM